MPFFLFKWNATIEMSPDLDDVRELCRDRKTESYLLQSYQDMIMSLKEIDIKQITADQAKAGSNAAATNASISKKGTRAELISYLVAEVGSEIEFAWRTRYFYITGQIKTDDLGSALGLLSKGGLL